MLHSFIQKAKGVKSVNAKFKRGIFIAVSLLLFLGLIFAGIHHLNDYPIEQISQGSKDAESVQVQSRYPSVDIVTRTQDVDGIRIHEQFPEFQTPRLNQMMQNFVDHERQKFAEGVEASRASRQSLMKPYYHLYFEIYPLGTGYYSFVMHTEKDYAGANPEIHLQPYIVDLSNDSIVDAKQLFSEDYYADLKAYLLDQLKADEERGSFIIDEIYEQYLAEHHLGEQLVLTHDKAEFVFEAYAVGARAAGEPVVALTHEQLAEYLTDDAVKKLGEITENKVLAEREETVTKRKAPELPPNMPSVVTHNEQAGKKVAITFDDGPHPENTPAILNLLDQYGAKATFFMLGSTADFYPDLIQKVARAGHEVGNHSWNHPQLTLLDDQRIQEEVNRSDQVFEQELGYRPPLMRPPYGDFDERVIQQVHKPLVLWSIDTLDWQSHNPQAILQIVKDQLHDGAIILMHDIHAETVEATRLVLEYLSSQGYEMVTVSELFE